MGFRFSNQLNEHETGSEGDFLNQFYRTNGDRRMKEELLILWASLLLLALVAYNVADGREYCLPADPNNIPTFYYTTNGQRVDSTRILCPRTPIPARPYCPKP